MIRKQSWAAWATIILGVVNLAIINDVGAAEVRLIPYLETHGKETDAGLVSLDRQPAQITVVFKPRQAGVYSYGLSVEADKIAPLAPSLPSYSADSLRSRSSYGIPTIGHIPARTMCWEADRAW